MSLENRKKAKTFAELHQKHQTFILANAWDAASARIFEKAGFQAIGTTSAGIAAARGYPDGQKIPLDEMLDAISQIVSAVNVPVSVDIEAGFGKNCDEIVNTVKKVTALGAIGINIEDATGDKAAPIYDVGSQVEKIKTIRRAISSEDLWINARVDPFYLGMQGPEALTETINRAQAYHIAGADSIFVVVHDKELISKLTKEIKAPINLLAGPKLPSINELKQLGVARVSLGSAPMRATLGLLQEISKELLEHGTYLSLTNQAVSYASLQELFHR